MHLRWEWLITASLPYLVALIASPLPPLLHFSLGFNSTLSVYLKSRHIIWYVWFYILICKHRNASFSHLIILGSSYINTIYIIPYFSQYNVIHYVVWVDDELLMYNNWFSINKLLLQGITKHIRNLHRISTLKFLVLRTS